MREFILESSDAGQRLDRFLKKLFPSAGLSFLYGINRKNKVKVDGKKQENEYILQPGSSVKIFLSDLEIADLQAKPISFSIKKEPLSPKDIIFEDSEVLVVNKNPHCNVHPGDHKTTEISLIDQVGDYFKDTALSTLTFKPSLVHRIDRDTSGIILIAKTKSALDSLLFSLQNDKIHKTYLAIWVGIPKTKTGTITARLRRIENAKNENKVLVDEKNGLKAVTHYKTLATFDNRYCLLECVIETGRMHQIRVHLASIGIPVLGDKIYGDKSENAFVRWKYHIDRQMLHAWKVSFPHPKDKKMVSLTAELKDDMRGFIKKFLSEDDTQNF